MRKSKAKRRDSTHLGIGKTVLTLIGNLDILNDIGKQKRDCWPINEEEQGKREMIQIEALQSQYSC